MTNDQRIKKQAEVELIKDNLLRMVGDVYPDSPEEEYPNPNDDIEFEYTRLDKLKSELYEDSYIKKVNTYKEAYNLSIGNYKSGTILNDHETTHDLFNRQGRAELIANFICNPSTKTPLNIGVFAKWGEGKTTFLSFIENNIKNQNSNNDFHIVKYDASEYEEREKVWANLAKVLIKSYESEVRFCKIKYLKSKIMRNKKKYIDSSLVNLCFFILVCLLALGTNISFSTTNIMQVLVSFGLSISGIILLVTKLIIPFVKSLLSTSIPLSKKFITTMKLPNYVEDLGRRESITEEINTLFSAWFISKTEKIILIVDELDRCSQKGIIEFFQSIQILSNVKNLVVIFAIDPTQLKDALQKEFKIKDNEIEDFSTRYLDKYITLPISLKNDIRFEKYIDVLVSESLYEGNSNFLTPGEKVALKKIIQLIPDSLLTPRKIKKLINMLTISKEYCINIINSSNNPIDFREYILWFIFSYFYKDTSIAILKHYENDKKHYPLKDIYRTISPVEIDSSNNVKDVVTSLFEITMYDLVNYNSISNQIIFSI